MSDQPPQSASPAGLPPADDQALVAEIHGLLKAGRTAVAVDRSKAAIALSPDRAIAHAMLALAEVSRGQTAAALAALQTAVAFAPDNLGFQFQRAGLVAELGRYDEVVTILEPLMDRVVDNAEAQYLWVSSLAASGRHDAACAAVDAALVQLPDSLRLLTAKGVLARDAGRLRDALALQEAVLARDPDYRPALCEAGMVLQQLGRPRDAVAVLDRVLEQDGDIVPALVAMALAESDLQMHEAAFAAIDRAWTLQPSDTEIGLQRGVLLQRLGRPDEAIAQLKKVIELAPADGSAHCNIGAILLLRGRYTEAVEWLEQARALDPDNPAPHSNLLFAQLHDPAVELAALAAGHRAFGHRFDSPEDRYRHWPNDLDPDRKLRIGLVSAEFLGHASNALILTFLEGIDRNRFALVGFNNNPVRDATTRRFIGLLDDMVNVVGLDDRTMAAEVRALGIDILVDLNGHTGMNRLTCFALKPAPVQASWLGYPFSTGLSAIDYSIMDAVAVRPGEEVHFVETVVRLDGTRICIEPSANAPEVTPPPVLRRGYVTFGSFNRVNKLTDEVIALWCRILHAVPHSRLMLKDGPLGSAGEEAERLRRLVAAAAVDPVRLELRGGSDYWTYLRDHGDFDIALDPFPFSGAATSIDALWMGLPIVTLPGPQPVSRQAETFLHGLGRREWVAKDKDEYVQIAERLARNPLRLADLRAGQRHEILQSRLCDKHAAARDLERAFRSMWHGYVATRADLVPSPEGPN